MPNSEMSLFPVGLQLKLPDVSRTAGALCALTFPKAPVWMSTFSVPLTTAFRPVPPLPWQPGGAFGLLSLPGFLTLSLIVATPGQLAVSEPEPSFFESLQTDAPPE